MDQFLEYLGENAGDENRAPYVSFDEDYVNQPARVDYMVYQVSMVIDDVASHPFWLAHGAHQYFHRQVEVNFAPKKVLLFCRGTRNRTWTARTPCAHSASKLYPVCRNSIMLAYC